MRWWLPVAIGGSLTAVATIIALRPSAEPPATVEAEPERDTPRAEPQPTAQAPALPAIASPTSTEVAPDRPRTKARRNTARRKTKPEPAEAEPKKRDLDALLPGSYRDR